MNESISRHEEVVGENRRMTSQEVKDFHDRQKKLAEASKIGQIAAQGKKSSVPPSLKIGQEYIDRGAVHLPGIRAALKGIDPTEEVIDN